MASCILGGRAIASASATSLGGLSSDRLVAFERAAGSSAPQLATCDNFDLADGDLAGRTVSDALRCNGLAWAVHAGTWTVGGGWVSATGATPAVATLTTVTTTAAAAPQAWGQGQRRASRRRPAATPSMHTVRWAGTPQPLNRA